MAKFIPPVPASFHGSWGEEQVFEAMRLLDDSYTIFHSYSWIGINERTQGEADFIIIHPDKGILVIEVKSGEIQYRDGQWIQTNTVTRESFVIRPFDQANRSRFELLDRLGLLKQGRTPLVCFAVWFPSIIVMPHVSLPAEAAREIVLDERSLVNVKQAVDGAFAFWADKLNIHYRMSQTQLREVVETIAPQFNIIPGMRAQLAEMERAYILLTRQQAALLEYLHEQRTAVIHGMAGTGKTVLAKEKARMLSADGEAVLYLCYNSFLKDYLRKSYSCPGVIYHNAHSLAAELLPDPNLGLDELLGQFEDWLCEVFEPDDWPYQHVIIDEGQDLSDRLVNRLSELAEAKGGCFYVFYDRNQHVMRNEPPRWLEEAECRLVLHRNCRNTVQIARTACSMIGHAAGNYELAVQGEVPVVNLVGDKKELIAAVEAFVKRALGFGILPHEIVLLTVGTEQRSLFAGIEAICGVSVTNILTDNKVLFTTVRKFKGLEAKAVMVLDVSLRGLVRPDIQRLVYVGSSRAKYTLGLAVLDDADISGVVELMGQGRNLPKSKRGLARLLGVRFAD